MKPGAAINLAISAAIGVAAYLVYRGVKFGAGAVGDAAWAVAPWNHDNVIAETVNSLGAGLVSDPAGPGKNSDGSWTLGGWFYDITHPNTYNAIRNISDPIQISSGLTDEQASDARTAYAARDPRRVDIAAFGIYPKP